MRIAVVAQPFDAVLPPAQNSIGIIAYNTAVQLARRAKVTVFLPGPPETELIPKGSDIQWIWIPTGFDERMERLVGRFPGLTRRRSWVSWPLFYAAYVLRIGARLRRDPHDIVHLFNFPQFARLIGSTVSADTRVSLEMQCDWLSQWDPAWVRPGLRRCDMVWGVSSHVTDLIRGAHPGLRARLDTVYNGFDTERFQYRERSADSEFRALFVGRVSPEKGIHLLIEAIGKLAPRYPSLRLRLVGPRTQLAHELIVGVSQDPMIRTLDRFYGGDAGDDYQAYLDRRIAELGIADRVSFAGNVPQAELAEEYARADVLVNPSYSESFGMSLVEAMAVGRPVVASRVGGMPDIIEHERTGLLFDCGDVQGLTEALETVISDPACRIRMADAGRQRAGEQFSWQARADRLWAGFMQEQAS